MADQNQAGGTEYTVVKLTWLRNMWVQSGQILCLSVLLSFPSLYLHFNKLGTSFSFPNAIFIYMYFMLFVILWCKK